MEPLSADDEAFVALALSGFVSNWRHAFHVVAEPDAEIALDRPLEPSESIPTWPQSS